MGWQNILFDTCSIMTTSFKLVKNDRPKMTILICFKNPKIIIFSDVRNIMGDEKSGSDVEVDNDSVFSAPDCTKAEMTNQKSVPVGPMVVPVQVETPNWSNIDSSKTLPLGGAQVPLTNSLGKKSQFILIQTQFYPY